MKYVSPIKAPYLILLLASISGNSWSDALSPPQQPLDCVIKPSEIIDVGSPVSGVIKDIFFDRSQLVNKGDTLLQIDARVEQVDAMLAEKRANTNTAIKLREAVVNLGYKTKKRSQNLLNDSLIPAQEFDNLDNDIRIAELNLTLEQEAKEIAVLSLQRSLALLTRKTIASPISGVVTERFKSIGERVNDDPLLRLAQLDPLHIEVVIPAEYLPTIQLGMRALATPKIPNAKQHVATVTLIDKVMDAASGTFGVRLALANPTYEIPAGILCKLEFAGSS